MAYEILNHMTYRVNDDGERLILANFAARIIEERRYVDGTKTEIELVIEGTQKGDKKPITLPKITISAQTFLTGNWATQNWGVRAVVQPGAGIRDDLRAAVQLFSSPKVTTIYKKTGWQMIGNRRTYLHAAGGITEKGNDPKITVSLPIELRNYKLPTLKDIDIKDALIQSLRLTELAPPHIAWTLFAATYAPPVGPIDFAIHVTGRTGTFKSEVASLFQSHYGEEMDARHLPGSWSSTANALEAQAYYAANALFAVDDFVPIGTAYQVRAYQTTADKLIRGQGNQAGRARLTDTSNLQEAMYPRGLILSTGEDTPEGHSLRARMMILDLSPGDIKTPTLTQAQAQRAKYSQAMAAWIQYLAAAPPTDLTQSVNALRTKYAEIGHTRTPAMLARLVDTVRRWLNWAAAMKAIQPQAAAKLFTNAETALTEAAKNQSQYLEEADPIDAFCATIRQICALGQGHFRSLNGGIPGKPTSLGWTTEQSPGDMPTYKSHGPCMGWVNWPNGELYLDQSTGLALIKKHSGAGIPLTPSTLVKRLKDCGMLTRIDDSRQRNTIRITAEKHIRTVLCLSAAQVLDTLEAPPEPDETPPDLLNDDEQDKDN